MKKNRKWLEKNEIYFTTLTTVSLSIMAIVVTYNSNRIAEQQLNLNYNENKPDFHISSYYIRNSQTGMAEEYEIAISKYGGKAKNIGIDNISYLQFEFQDSLMRNYQVKFQLGHYFDQSYGNGNNSGIIKTIKGYKNNIRLLNLTRTIENELRLKGYKYIFNKTETYVRISYIDFNEKKNIEDYKLKSGNGILFNEPENKIFKVLNHKQQIYLNEIDKMDIKEITERIITTANN